MPKTIANTVTSTVTLTAAYDPLNIAITGAISTTAAAAIYGGASQAWLITNSGDIQNHGQFGIELLSGSTVVNNNRIADASSIGEAVRINGGAGTVSNSGTISGGYDGVVLTAGGTVSNSAGEIAGAANDGVYIGGGAGTVTNAGLIAGGRYAVQFVGSFADQVIIDAGAVFQGKVAGGSGGNALELAAGSPGVVGTLTGLGSRYTGFDFVTVDSGANWQFDAANTVASGVDLTDAGTLANAGLINTSMLIDSGGTFSNTGVINRIVFVTDRASVSNSGTISSSLYGVFFLGAGTLTNTGQITAASSNYSIRPAFGVYGTDAAATVTNASGSIFGNYDGVALMFGGTVVNKALIAAGDNTAVYVGGGNGTLTNAGTITAGIYGQAVQFVGNYADRVIIDPGAVFTGVVQGDSGTNTLELAAGGAGTVGTLSAFASEFLNFGTIAVDSGATWQMDGTDTIASSIVLTDAGSLASSAVIETTATLASGANFTNSGTVDAGSGQIGVTLLAGGVASNSLAHSVIEGGRYGIRAGRAATITNAGTIIGTSSLNGGGIGLYAGGSVTNTGTIIGDGAAGIYIGGGAGIVTNAGTISGATESIKFAGFFNDQVIIEPGAVFEKGVQGGSATNTLELAPGGNGVTGTLASFAATFSGFHNIYEAPTANWQFAASTTIAAGTYIDDVGLLTNAGVIDGHVIVNSVASLVNSGTLGTSATVELLNGGHFTNTGLCENGCYDIGSATTVTNSGTILSDYRGISLDGGTVINSGQIIASTNTVGQRVEGVRIFPDTGVVMNNAGQISGSNYGVALYTGGTVVNKALISAGVGTAVLISDASGTVTNAGTITAGTQGDAVKFGGSFADRMILQPGAVFNGLVQGGSGTNTLELAAGSAGAVGTLASLASFAGFGTITIDSGAAWKFAATNTVGSSVTLTDNGTLSNAGLIQTTAQLADGASLSNSGTITGSAYGVSMAGGGTVTNTGLIDDNASQANSQGLVCGGAADFINNAGTIAGGAEGVVLNAGGSVLNKGLIAGGENVGIAFFGGGGTITNAGTISGHGQPDSVLFSGSYTDRIIFDAGAVFQGVVAGGSGSNTLELAAGSAGAIGTLSAFVKEFANFGTIAIDAGASWLVAANSTIGSAVTLTDAGKLTNAGLIDTAVTVTASTSLGNSGVIYGASYGVQMTAGGTLNSSGTITAAAHGEAVQIAGGIGTITNTGSISAGIDGVVLTDGGKVHTSGAIAGGNFGVYIGGGAGTVTNAGTISGGAEAVEFKGAFTDRVVFDAGAVFKGAVQGGSGSNTLELAAGSAGVVGTLSSFAAGFSGFGTIAIGSGATWTIAASSTIAAISASAQVYFTDAGTLTNAGAIDTSVRVTANRSLSNSGTIASSLGTGVVLLAGGTIKNTGSMTATGAGKYAIQAVGAAARLTNSGLISGSQDGAFLQAGGTVTNSASITGKSSAGIYISGGAGTVTNAGTITGGTDSIKFVGAFNDRVILDRGAVLKGNVLGGSGTNTLELAAAGSAAAGTLANLGGEFKNFGQIDVDAAATWSVTGENPFAGNSALPAVSLAAGATLKLTGGGALQADITGNGLLQLQGSTAFSFTATDTLDGVSVNIAAGATLSATGTIGSSLDVAGTFSAASGTLVLKGALGGAGNVTAAQGATLEILGGGTFAGTLGGSGNIVLGTGLTFETGSKLSASGIVDDANLILDAGVSLQNGSGHSFTVSAASGQTLTITGGNGFTNAGTFTETGGGINDISTAFTNTAAVSALKGTLAFLGTAVNQGSIDAAAASVSFQKLVSGTGTLQIGSTGTLSLDLGASSGQTVDFLASTGLLDLADPIAFAGTISGFAGNDRIDLLNTPETSYSYANNILTVKNGTSTVASLHFTGTSNSFSLTSDLHGGTLIEFK